MKLSIKQTIALDYLEDNVTTEIGYGGGAGGGKSILGCYWQLKNRLKYPDTRGLIGRASLKTLKETTLQSFFYVANQQGLKANVHYKYNAQSNQILFPNKSIIFLKDLFLYPSDPNFDELGSLEITDLFIDETAQISKKAWDIAQSRIRYNLDKYNLVPKSLWSSNPSKNWNYSDYFLPYEKEELPRHRKFVQSLVTDNPYISKHYIDNLHKLPEIDKQRLLYGNWRYDNDPAKLIEYDKIIDLFSNEHANGGLMYITADIARYGSDKAVIIVWCGWRVEYMLSIPKCSIPELADKIKEIAINYQVPLSNIVCDEDGVGGGVVDILKCKGFVNGSKPFDEEGNPVEYNNLKSQCYFHLAKKINEAKVLIKPQEYKETIIQELEQVKRHNIDKDGKLSVIPKEKVKEMLGRSPDFSDALMMRLYFELKPKQEVFFF
ncbi:terminase family protein [Elizabethkingia meningoseptica]|uniref:terminase large subunit domain-containing protein n=1 Tax=Elizabethkingia meningoseptica TaxID=238 RepID=UPI0023AF46A7|nr:terminase family protein [Elizabethkingia meningoseptica]MDE5516412.1 terminase family protein [Elizabethkingia meningoseptica]MDE5526657.1 terminase family protein [Elizabethkingia meningoseptica]MDN4033730.1 terminase family protein [Elizabethkingia meningoseptica]